MSIADTCGCFSQEHNNIGTLNVGKIFTKSLVIKVFKEDGKVPGEVEDGQKRPKMGQRPEQLVQPFVDQTPR